MRALLRILTAATCFAISGCDPAMSIRQADSNPRTEVVVRVKTSHHFVVNRFYAPEVTATNLSEASIAVREVVLRKESTVYENRPHQDASYPVVISAGDTKRLDVWFDLDDDVGATFKKPVEIIVRYRAGEKDSSASATLVGGRLSASNP